MKKFFIFLLIVTLCPVMACGEIAMDNHPDDMVGCWAIFIPTSNAIVGDQCISVVLNKDGTMSLFVSLDSGGEVQTMAATGKWSDLPGAILFQRDGKETFGHWEKRDGLIWFELSGAFFGLAKLPPAALSQVVYPASEK